MSTINEFEKELETEEKKHKKILEIDFIGIAVIAVIIIAIVIVNLFLKSAYKPIRETESVISQSLTTCNKTILDLAETFRSNSTDSAARVIIDEGKRRFDVAIMFYGSTIKKGNEGLLLEAVDSCYLVAARFRTMLESQGNLKEVGISAQMLNDIDRAVVLLKERRNMFLSEMQSYNNSGFMLNFNWLTPYPGKIAYTANASVEMEPVVKGSPANAPSEQ